MDNQCLRICPLCGAPVGLFNINFNEKVLMCEDPMCEFPFGFEELQIVTDESQLRDNVEWNGVPSLLDNDVSSASSVVSTTGWADIEQLTRLYDSDACTVDSRSSQLSQQAMKRKEKKMQEEEITKNLTHIKKLNEELNQLKCHDRYSRIEKDDLLENLFRIQQMSGQQMLKKEEMENLQKRKEAELGMGELKININTAPNEMGVINIEICNNNNNNANNEAVEPTDNPTIHSTKIKKHINLEEDIPVSIKQTVNNENVIESNQNNKPKEKNAEISEQLETINSNPQSSTIEANTTDNMNKENTQDGSSLVYVASNADILHSQEVIEQEATTEKEMQVPIVDNLQVTVMDQTQAIPGDVMQIIEMHNVQVLPVVDEMQVLTVVDEMHHFPPITLEELTSKVALSELKCQAMNEMQNSMVDDMQFITMNEESAPREVGMQDEVVEPQPTVKNNLQFTSELEVQVPAIKEPKNTAVETRYPTVIEPNVSVANKILVTAVVQEKAPAESHEIQPTLPATSETACPALEVTPPVLKKKRGRPRKVPKEIHSPDTKIVSNTQISKLTEQNNNANLNISVDTEPNIDHNNSLDINQTSTVITSNIDQKELIEISQELNEKINTSTESSTFVKEPKTRGRMKGSNRVVKNTVVDVRRSTRLSGKNT